MIKDVVCDPNPFLHKKSLPIHKTAFGSGSLQKLIDDMKDTLAAEDGLGLAAPQIGESLSIFILPDSIAPEVRVPTILFSLIKPLRPTVFINPEIISYSKEKETMAEGCLSIRAVFKPTSRSLRVKIKFFDERGRKISLKAEGLLARVFQHETDHLEGVLFIERI